MVRIQTSKTQIEYNGCDLQPRAIYPSAWIVSWRKKSISPTKLS